MVIIADLLIATGVLGLLGSTVGSVSLAWLLSLLSFKKFQSSASIASSESFPTIDILIPVHNEAAVICKTLHSIVHARDLFLTRQRHLGFQSTIRICIGADHCSDKTEDTISRFVHSRRIEGVEMIKNRKAAGKWNMLQQLIHQSDADWVALVDSGSVWESALLDSALPHFLKSDVMAVAPSYRPAQAGWVEKMHWRVERFFKWIEGKAGGPTSVHGATVIYRRKYLVHAFEALKPKAWLNDDVVIPLALRTLFPTLRIEYLERKNGNAWVQDHGIELDPSVEYKRRKRMLLGNLQWIQSLFLQSLQSDARVGMIASRRVFRTFWAYWVLALSLGIFIHEVNLAKTSAAAVALTFLTVLVFSLIPLSGTFSKVRAAFWAGLQIPFHWSSIARKTPEKIWN